MAAFIEIKLRQRFGSTTEGASPFGHGGHRFLVHDSPIQKQKRNAACLESVSKVKGVRVYELEFPIHLARATPPGAVAPGC